LVEKLYVITNNTSGGFAITIGGVTGSTVTIPSGVTAQVYCNGTNFFSSQTGSAGNFTVNGTLSATGVTNTGNMSIAGTLGVTGATTLTGATSLTTGSISGIMTAPTAAPGTNTTQLATTAFVAANPTVLTGSLLMWPTASAPTGYLACDGSAVSRTTYAALFAITSTTFGVGDGSTTFNLPNYTNRMPYGATIGTTGGSADAVVVSHTHTATSTDSGHTHTVPSGATGSSTPTGPGGAAAPNPQTTATGNAVITTTIATAGVSGTNANLPPYLGINFIIKT
jgi:microcystin-dependent protein